MRKGSRGGDQGDTASKLETESTDARIRGTIVIEVKRSAASFVSFINVDDPNPLSKVAFIKKVVEASKMASMLVQLFWRYVDVIVVAVKDCFEELWVMRGILVDDCSSHSVATKFLGLGCHETLQGRDCDRDGAWPEKYRKDNKHRLPSASACI